MPAKNAPENQASLPEAPPAEQTPLPVATVEPVIVQPAPELPRQELALAEPVDRIANSPERAIAAFASESNFVGAQRMAKALAASSLMPREYQGNIPNVLIALDMASRIGVSVLMVAQNLNLIHNRPSWASTFLIATVNQCGRFSPLRFKWQGEEGTDAWGCRAVAKERSSGEPLVGTLITIALAKREGWYQKSGSKWQTMPEQMLCYRAAAFWTRIYAPELSLGMHTNDEVIDTYGEDVAQTVVPAGLAPGSTGALEAALRSKANGSDPTSAIQ